MGIEEKFNDGSIIYYKKIVLQNLKFNKGLYAFFF